MPTDWELWACAQKLIKQHQAKAPLQVAIRISELATDGDADGVRTWQRTRILKQSWLYYPTRRYWRSGSVRRTMSILRAGKK